MTNNIHFVTSNAGKVLALQNRLAHSVKVLQVALDIPEIQADSAETIVRHKAREAYSRLHKPLIMQDSAFHIRALNGFPGPYIKFVNETIGPDGVLKLLASKKDRSCYFDQVAVYIDRRGQEHIFKNTGINSGTIALQKHETNITQAWSAIWQIYIPSWADKPLAALSAEIIDRHERESDVHSEMYHFARWYKTRREALNER